jgi:hypothetical protein
MGELVTDLSKVTRVHIVPDTGNPSVEFWADHWEPYLQDDGRTLKLFAHGDGAPHQQARDEALAEEISQRLIIDQPDDGEALRDFISYIQPTLPSPLAEQARLLLEKIDKGQF